MSQSKKNRSNFLVQGSILAMASIISRIIGLVYRLPMTAILKDVGIGYYGTAFEIYRETKHRTDIWIESENDIIVIENKINSGKFTKIKY